MTDKQIIIDGCDVSGCEYIIPPHKQCPNKTMPYAKETSCFACKEHNTKLNFCKNNPNCYYKQLKQLEQYKKSKQASYEELQKKCNELELENRKLKQTIAEIKEIAESNCEITDDSWMSQTMNLQEVLIKILQKISEVEDEEVI